jgi:phosphopantothenate-cysteine ligase
VLCCACCQSTCRFIDNFSTGNRGAATTEQLLDAGYAVIFVHRAHSAFPFARRLMPPAQSAEDWLRSLAAGGSELAAKAAAAHAACEDRLLALPFTSVVEYLQLLRDASCALAQAGVRAMLVLSAAVSDFYLPPDELPEHKIQSAVAASGGGRDGGGGGGVGSGGLSLHLRPVPKVLGRLKRGGDASESPWAPEAFVVSFKLETNSAILLAKAAGAIAKYGVDLVCANLLQTYKREVTLVSARSASVSPSVGSGALHGDEVEHVPVEGVECKRLSTDVPGEEMEQKLVAELCGRHGQHIENGGGHERHH